MKIMLGNIEISDKAKIKVEHNAMYRYLAPRLHVYGRTGKQKNWRRVFVQRKSDNQVELTLSGWKGREIVQLWAWQEFIDKFPDVEVTTVSRNTIPMTPQLVKMARDVNAFRRPIPSDDEWAREMAHNCRHRCRRAAGRRLTKCGGCAANRLTPA